MDQVNNEMLRESLEKIVGTDDSAFSGFDLATLIRKKIWEILWCSVDKEGEFSTSGIT